MMLRRLRLLTSVAALTSGLRPPVARTSPHRVAFGKVEGENRGGNPMDPALLVNDDYFWIRDDTRKDEEILGLLRDENAYTQAATAHLEDFRARLYDEMLGHTQEDDETYPSPSSDGWEYWSRTMKGSSFRQYLRRRVGTEGAGEVILDVNEVATLPYFAAEPNWAAAQCDVHAVEPSPSGALLAYSVDGSGYETYNIRLKDLTEGGAELEEQIVATAGSIAWAGDASFFYVKQDGAHRPFQVWRHDVGTAQAADVLVYEDLDDLFNVACWSSNDGALVFIESESKETTELRFLDASAPTEPPTLVRAREFGVRYDADSHAPSRSLFITTNAGGCVNRELLTASIDAPSEWSPLLTAPAGGRATAPAAVLPHSASRSLTRVAAFSTFLAVAGREEGFTQVWVVPLAEGGGGAAAASDATRLAFEADAFTATLARNDNFNAGGKLRVEYSSMTSPPALIEVDVGGGGGEHTTLKVKPVPNYDASLYETRRTEVTARDGAKIPVTLLWRPDAVGGLLEPGGGGAPCHLYGYGSYGICMEPSFTASALPLVDRGVVFAIAHVRGGGEMGHHEWYERQGKYLAKKNTFHDFIDCGEALVERGVARAGALTCEGRSAGGLLVGNVVNMAPELWAAAVAGVPFVDLMTTMCDPSIPLTTEEWEEWGNPNEARYYDYMRSYSPIDTVREGAAYPSLLIVSGLNDPRVAYWEPTKWAQVLRAKVANGDDVLLKMDLDAGHFSASDRYRYLRELAFDYSWLLWKLGKVDA